MFINEYGMVSIDDLMLDDQTPEVQIQELAGGCFCCTTSAIMDTVLMQFIRRTKPDRLLIEPSGAGHPARVIDALRSPRFKEAIDLRATICLVDPKDFENPRVTNNEGFHDQIQMSDVVAISWTDKREASQIERCRQWINQFDPPKLLVTETQFGKLNPDWLDLNGIVVRTPRFPHAHSAGNEDKHQHSDASSPLTDGSGLISLNGPAVSDRPVRRENAGNGQRACGWIFSSDEIFDREDLFDYLASIRPMQRIKGIFRCDDDWWLFNRSGSEISITPTAYRRDSRVEFITDASEPGWNEVEDRLIHFARKSAGPQ